MKLDGRCDVRKEGRRGKSAGFVPAHVTDADPSRKDPPCPMPTAPTSLLRRAPSCVALPFHSLPRPLPSQTRATTATHLIANQQHIPKALCHYQRMPLPAALQQRIRGDSCREPDGGELVDGEGLAWRGGLVAGVGVMAYEVSTRRTRRTMERGRVMVGRATRTTGR